MKKLALIAAVLGLTVSAYAAAPALPAGINAVGYDANLGHITARLGLTANNAVDLGVGLNYNSAAATDKMQLGLSGFYLLKLQDWGVVDNYAFAGGVVNIFSDSDLGLSLSAGLQPEITFLDHFIFSIRFGVTVPVLPDFALQTAGQPISLVNGLNFKIIW
jgi:hypothetical protein